MGSDDFDIEHRGMEPQGRQFQLAALIVMGFGSIAGFDKRVMLALAIAVALVSLRNLAVLTITDIKAGRPLFWWIH